MIIDALEREWNDRLGTLPSPWSTLPGTLDDVLAAIRRAPDETLATLLGHLADGDELAGRTVVQTMLPSLRLLARDLDEQTLVAELWLRAATYPLARRPRRIAANLALDTRKAAWCARRAELRERPVGLEPQGRIVPPADDVTAVDVLDRAVHLRLVTPDTREVLDTVYRQGLPGRVAAGRHGLSEPALRTRCSKAVRRMSANRLALVA